MRDWVHVRDHCDGVHRVWRECRVDEVYNFGGRCAKTNLEMTHTLLDLLGKPRSLIRYIHDRRCAIDCSKIKPELGWRPAGPLNRY